MAGIYFPRGASQNTPTPNNLQKLPDDYDLPFDLDPFSTPRGWFSKAHRSRGEATGPQLLAGRGLDRADDKFLHYPSSVQNPWRI